MEGSRGVRGPQRVGAEERVPTTSRAPPGRAPSPLVPFRHVLLLGINHRLAPVRPPLLISAIATTWQVTYEQDRDVCLLFFFSMDDQTLIYLREGCHGSELYHLFAVDLDLMDQSETRPLLLAARDLIVDPKMTCALGFVGGVQIWCMPDRPRHILLATGTGSLFWDVSLLNLDTRECTVVERNIMSTWYGKAWFLLASLWSVAVRKLTCGWLKPAAPGATIWWFPDLKFQFRGRLDATLADLSATWSVREGPRGKWRPLQRVAFDDLNMQLIGSSGGSGTARMDFSEDGLTVDVHTCVGGDTTRYVRSPVASGGQGGQTLAHRDGSDITGFVVHPVTRTPQCIVVVRERPEMCALDPAMEAHVGHLQDTFQDMAFGVVDRTLDDTAWIVFAHADRGHAICAGCSSAYFLYRPRLRDPTPGGAAAVPGAALEMLFSPRPGLAGYRLAGMEPVYVKARDGEDLLCYLSSPGGAQGVRLLRWGTHPAHPRPYLRPVVVR